MPAIWMLERRYQLGDRSTRETRGLRLVESFRHDSIDSSHSAAHVWVEMLQDFIGNGTRGFDRLPIHIGDVQVTVRRVGAEHGPKPGVLRSQKLECFLVSGALGVRYRPPMRNLLVMHDVLRRISHESIADVL